MPWLCVGERGPWTSRGSLHGFHFGCSLAEPAHAPVPYIVRGNSGVVDRGRRDHYTSRSSSTRASTREPVHVVQWSPEKKAPWARHRLVLFRRGSQECPSPQSLKVCSATRSTPSLSIPAKEVVGMNHRLLRREGWPETGTRCGGKGRHWRTGRAREEPQSKATCRTLSGDFDDLRLDDLG